MKRISDIPEYADSAVVRSKPTTAAIVVAGIVAIATAFAVFGDAMTSLDAGVYPAAPAASHEPNLCEPDGTFCEPTYLTPPPAEPAPAGSGLITSQRETPSG